MGSIHCLAFLFYPLERSNSPYINHFLSADTIVAGMFNPQNLNRYSYVTNNPLRYTDPTGHERIQDGPQDDDFEQSTYDDYVPQPNNQNGGGGNNNEDDDESENTDFCDPILGCENPDAGIFCEQTNCWYDSATNISGTYQDPAVYISLAFGGWGSGLYATSFWGTAAACISNSVCSLLTGMAGGTTAQNLGSNPQSGVTVLGYTEDLVYYENVNVNMLQNVPNYTWSGTNVPFLNQAIARGDTIVYISDFAQYPLRTFPQEVQFIQQSGYLNVIDMFRLR